MIKLEEKWFKACEQRMPFTKNKCIKSSLWRQLRDSLALCSCGGGDKDPLPQKMRQPGVEPGSIAWKATMLTATPPTLLIQIRNRKEVIFSLREVVRFYRCVDHFETGFEMVR